MTPRPTTPAVEPRSEPGPPPYDASGSAPSPRRCEPSPRSRGRCEPSPRSRGPCEPSPCSRGRCAPPCWGRRAAQPPPSRCENVKVCFYIAQYPVRWTAQSALHFTPWQPCSFRHQLDFSGRHSSNATIRREKPGTHLYS